MDFLCSRQRRDDLPAGAGVRASRPAAASTAPRWPTKTLGTFPQGAVRFSVGPFTTFEELDYVHGAVYDLLLEVGNQ